MEKTRIWNVPEGFMLDKEQSTETQVVLKRIVNEGVNSWEEYCKLMKGKDSCFVDMNGNVRTTNFSSTAAVGEFEDEEDAVAFAALYKLISLRKNWVGEWKSDWSTQEPKFVINNFKNNVECGGTNFNVSRSLSFPTENMCNEFYRVFKDLLEQAKPLL